MTGPRLNNVIYPRDWPLPPHAAFMARKGRRHEASTPVINRTISLTDYYTANPGASARQFCAQLNNQVVDFSWINS